MIDAEAFANGMGRLGTAFNVALTEERLMVFYNALSSKLDGAKWEKAVGRAIEAETFFPPPAVLLRYGLADGSLAARASEALEKILLHFERGEKIGYRQVKDKYGYAAAEAFMAAGGAGRFEWCEPDSVPFRLKDFTAAFLDVAEVDPIAIGPAEDRAAISDSEIFKRMDQISKAGVTEWKPNKQEER